MKIGNRAIKRSSGYNLVDLITGSEGTLAIVTAITLKLAGLPEGRLKTAFKFDTESNAAKAVSEICKYGIDVAAIEFLDRKVMKALNQLKDYNLEEVPALFLEFHGPESVLESNNELAESICLDLNGQKLNLSSGQNPWEIRHYVTDAIKYLKPGYTIIRNDVAFPISRLPEMVEFCHDLGSKNDLIIHTFGHVGLGLLHALLLADKNDEKMWSKAIDVNNQIIKKAIEFEGTISGEHGIGLGHKNLFELEHGLSVQLMKSIKTQFDPFNILNPGNIFDL
jgi:D-lactate dehydrogenase (cytochrome)